MESDDEILSLINIFASISLGLFFKIFIMGKNGIECDSEKGKGNSIWRDRYIRKEI